jgi:hypothetical protein
MAAASAGKKALWLRHSPSDMGFLLSLPAPQQTIKEPYCGYIGLRSDPTLSYPNS